MTSPRGSTWEPLRVPVFRALWLSSVTSNIGSWAHDVGAAWLMTSLTASALVIGLLQTAASAPLSMFALPAGALADLADRRRLLIIANLGVATTAAVLAIASMAGAVTPALLLAFTFVLGACAAFNNSTWQATIPDVVPLELVPSATTLNGVTVNLGRAVGPAVGGLMVAAAGPPAVFTLNAIAALVIVVVVWRWRGYDEAPAAPVEQFAGAMQAGLRFVRFSTDLRPVMVRALIFVVCGSAVWALLPLLARRRLGLGAQDYGFLLGALGAGAVLASNFLPAWRRGLGVDRLVSVASALLGGLFVLLTFTRSFPIALGVLFGVGMCWMAIMPTFNVAAIQALPKWVRARGLANADVVYQGGTAAGGLLWGVLANAAGIAAAFWIAAGGLAAGVLLATFFPMGRNERLDLRPAGHWPAVDDLVPVSDFEDGPVLVTVEYEIDPAKRDEFLALACAGRSARRRDGAFAWGIYEDVENRSRFIEEFRVATWSEHMRQHTRVTRHDQEQEALARAFHIGPDKPRVRHYLAADAPDRGTVRAQDVPN